MCVFACSFLASFTKKLKALFVTTVAPFCCKDIMVYAIKSQEFKS